MRTLATPGRPAAVASRWIWSVIGLVTVALLAVAGVRLITKAGNDGNGGSLQAVPTRTVTVSQPVTSLSVESYGAPIQVTAGPVHRVTVVEAISYGGKDGIAPAVTAAVSRGRLTLAAPACAVTDCSVGFTVTVPSGVPVTGDSDSGSVTVSGTAGATVDSGGGPVQATGIDGPLTVTSAGGNVTVSRAMDGASLDSGGGQVQASRINGPLTVDTEGGDALVTDAAGLEHLNSGGGAIDVARIRGPLTLGTDGGSAMVESLNGNLDASTGGGPLEATEIAAMDATVTTDGGWATLALISAPDNVLVSTDGGQASVRIGGAPGAVAIATDGGPAILNLPGGAYALTTASDGGSQQVAIAANPGAHRSISVSTGGGPLRIEPLQNS
jgi:hypothetical protein